MRALLSAVPPIKGVPISVSNGPLVDQDLVQDRTIVPRFQYAGGDEVDDTYPQELELFPLNVPWQTFTVFGKVLEYLPLLAHTWCGYPLKGKMSPEDRLKELGFSLPEAPAPVAAYVPAVWSGDLVFVSGQVPFLDGVLSAVGSVPDACSIEDATSAARVCGLNALAVLASSLPRGLSQVEQIVRLGVFVQSSPGFDGQPAIANGASELMQAVFGEAGRHARAAVGSIALPLDATVEVELVARVSPT